MNAEKIREFIQRNVGYLVAAFVSLVYVATSIIAPAETGKSLAAILVDGALSFFLGMVLTQVFSLQGIMRGNEDPRLLATVKLHGEQVIRIAPYIDGLDDWCEKKTAEALRRERTKVLAEGAMKYTDYFDEDGVAKPFVPRDCQNKQERKREAERFRVYQRAVKVKITPLLAGVLTGGGEKVEDPNNFGPDISEYMRSVLWRTALSKVLLACIFGYYGIRLIQDFSYAELVWKVFQVGMFCAMGVVQANQAYLFMVDQYRRRIVRFIDRLQEFETTKAPAQVAGEDMKMEEGEKDEQ